MRKDATHIPEAEHAILAALFKKIIVTIATYILQSRRERGLGSASCQEPPSLQPGPPSVVLCAETAAHKYEEALPHAMQKLVNDRQMTATKSQSGPAHPSTHTQASIQRTDTATRWRKPNHL